jgi:hypothetical protein
MSKNMISGLPAEELDQYFRLCAVLKELGEKYERRRARISLLLQEVSRLKQKTLAELGKARRLTRHLTVPQNREMGLLFNPGKPFRPGALPNDAAFDMAGALVKEAPFLKEALLLQEPPLPESFKNRRDLKAGEALVLSMIDALKRGLLELDVLEMRCRELLASITGAMAAYRKEYRSLLRRIYPFSIISRICKSFNKLAGNAYYSGKDIKELTALGNLTVNIVKMAEAPVI